MKVGVTLAVNSYLLEVLDIQVKVMYMENMASKIYAISNHVLKEKLKMMETLVLDSHHITNHNEKILFDNFYLEIIFIIK